jgi:hypothetical protein
VLASTVPPAILAVVAGTAQGSRRTFRCSLHGDGGTHGSGQWEVGSKQHGEAIM